MGLSGVKSGFGLTGKLGRGWVGAWRGAWRGAWHGAWVHGDVRCDVVMWCGGGGGNCMCIRTAQLACQPKPRFNPT